MKTVFFDVDTQNDFMLPTGALYVPKAELIIPAIARLNHYAASHNIPVISTTDAHAENDPEFQSWPPHCIAGTIGQQKPPSTLAGQIILRKQVLNCFDSPDLQPLLSTLNADQYVVYGVVTEICVRFAAFGLLASGKPVHLVTDAIKALNPTESDKTLAAFQAQGGHLATTATITGARP